MLQLSEMVPQALHPQPCSHLLAASPSIIFQWTGESSSLFLQQEGAWEASPGEIASLWGQRAVVLCCDLRSLHSCLSFSL